MNSYQYKSITYQLHRGLHHGFPFEFTGKDESYGNYGFMDQIEALNWVKRNIANFGGDPESITIMGNSAGAESTFYLLASPLANDLFHKVIATSEAVNARDGHRDYKRVAKITREKFLPLVGCQNVTDIRKCLQSLDANSFVTNNPFTMAVAPTPQTEDPGGLAVVEPVVIPISLWNFHLIPPPDRKIQVLMGSLAQEVGFYRSYDLPVDSYGYFMGAAKFILDPFDTSLVQQISTYYPPTYQNGSNTVTLSANLLFQTFMSDIGFTCPINKLALKFAESRNHDVYRFYIEHSPSKDHNISKQNAFHTWDTKALFNFKQSRISPTAHDKRLREELRAVYKTFIHEGDVYNEWKKIPSNTMVIRNSPGRMFRSGQPQQKQCKWLDDNGVTRYAYKDL